MLKTVRLILAIVIVLLAGFSIVTQNFDYMAFLMLKLSILMFVSGVIDLRADNKRGYMSIIASLFVLFVSIEGFLYL
ncbi:DUF3953 domain-containing protein [Halalkalibacter krulwichiae]|uniref:DUF3953 domain-containing protein n=1 Tax=Halalkalibacter krulwichiae TaxID=199441 RepID=A0A1X9MFZ7_9BACI|nr:DUF3953 domain-containing protein [Halalkalibacter krulwichiae]ARK32377.1 hypothetical protein BkAM31D_22345 [Halalkalibacter krulwichiae]